MKTLYFCFGDNRAEERQYRIFKIRDMTDVYELADALGLGTVLVNCQILNVSADRQKCNVISALVAIKGKLNRIENVVACVREEYDEAQRLKQHFLNADMELYFPKLVGAEDENGLIPRRFYPWIIDYWTRKIKHERSLGPMPIIPSGTRK